MRRTNVLCVACALAVLIVPTVGCRPRDEPNPFELRPAGVQKPRSVIPGTATIVHEGRMPLSYQPDRRGTLYLFDVTEQQTVLVERVGPQQRVEALPGAGAVQIGRLSFPVQELRADHLYRLYFDRSRR